MNVKLKKIEYHSVHSHMTYDIPEEDITETFGSVDRFKEIIFKFNPDSMPSFSISVSTYPLIFVLS